MNDKSGDGFSLPPCPVVAIGTSAGGVKALQAFFESLTAEARKMAYVVVVHLDPDHQSELASILSLRTRMPVTQVTDPVPMEPGHVYVIAPNRRLQIADHEISSAEFNEPRGQRAPIDLFFRSLAKQRGDGFAVILTGAGSDGALGVRAIKEAGGVVLVQDPREAEYPSMPRSAIATGVADFILPVRDIAAHLALLHSSKDRLRAQEFGASDEDILQRILGFLRARTGHDFSKYKRSTVVRRIARRLQVQRKESLQEYLDFFRDHAEEVQALFNDLLISVTSFFRDPAAFEALARQVIPLLFEGKSPSDQIRVWVSGCATGEEAYSIAILLAEESARRDVRPQLQVFASDLDVSALVAAREGRYPAVIEADVSEERLQRFFDREDNHYRIKREIRDILLFAPHSLLKDPPFSRLDLISCRNLLIYLDRELQQQACETFSYALLPNGFLFLGISENADNPPGVFRTIDREAHIFRNSDRKGERLMPPKLLASGHLHQQFGAQPYPRPAPFRDSSFHWQALEEAAPPSALVDETYALIHLSENAGRYLLHPRGQLTSDITELVRPELRLQLRAALHRSFEQHETSLSLPIAVRFNGDIKHVYLQVRPIRKTGGPPAALVLFIEGTEALLPDGLPRPVQGNGEAMQQLYDELNATRTRLKASIEEHESASEELRAANEELQSINEEYRSTAEELETSKEELQSVNEELQTVNNELKLKLEGVSRAHSDLQNLIGATDVGTLFLDGALRIKMFTPRMAQLFNITGPDEGRSITDFTHRLKYEGLVSDARRILADLGTMEKEIEAQNGTWFLMRLKPYRTVDDRIEGVVITFVDVTARRKAEAELRESEDRLQLASEVSELAIVDVDPARNTVWFDDRARALWGIKDRHAMVDDFLAGIHSADAGKVREALANAIASSDSGPIHMDLRLRGAKGVGERWIRLNGKAFFDEAAGKRAGRLVATLQDLTGGDLTNKLVVEELSHRMKNTLGIVLAMARQTLRGVAVDGAMANFEARLQALSSANEILRAGEWRGVDLSELIESQTKMHLGNKSGRLRVEGPRVTLPARLATSFGLLIHELATNAVKYGSLSNSKGSVDVEWSLGSRKGSEILLFRWAEKDGPPVVKPGKNGFGTQLIEQGVPEATVKREFPRTGVTCTIELPLAAKPRAQ